MACRNLPSPPYVALGMYGVPWSRSETRPPFPKENIVWLVDGWLMLRSTKISHHLRTNPIMEDAIPAHASTCDPWRTKPITPPRKDKKILVQHWSCGEILLKRKRQIHRPNRSSGVPTRLPDPCPRQHDRQLKASTRWTSFPTTTTAETVSFLLRARMVDLAENFALLTLCMAENAHRLLAASWIMGDNSEAYGSCSISSVPLLLGRSRRRWGSLAPKSSVLEAGRMLHGIITFLCICVRMLVGLLFRVVE